MNALDVRLSPVDLDDPADLQAWLSLMDRSCRERDLPCRVDASVGRVLAAWPGFYSWTAWHSRRAIGVVNCFSEFSTTEGGIVFTLRDLYVDPAHRMRGVARALVARGTEEARLLSCVAIAIALPEGPSQLREAAQRLLSALPEVQPPSATGGSATMRLR